jgi:hypothetical protein
MKVSMAAGLRPAERPAALEGDGAPAPVSSNPARLSYLTEEKFMSGVVA